MNTNTIIAMMKDILGLQGVMVDSLLPELQMSASAGIVPKSLKTSKLHLQLVSFVF